MVSITDTTKRRLAIAKEIFLLGNFHAQKNILVDNISAILNFDQCVEILIKSALIDYKENEKGDRPEQIKRLRKHFEHSFAEITSLHNLRNSVQHDVQVPSPDEIQRHLISVRQFFNDICDHVYEKKINFESTSLSFLIIGHPVGVIISKMENAYTKGNYEYVDFLAKKAVLAQVELLELNFGIKDNWDRQLFLSNNPPGFSYNFDNVSYVSITEKDFETKGKFLFNEINEYLDDLHRYVLNLEGRFSSITNYLLLGEFLSDYETLMGVYLRNYEPRSYSDINKKLSDPSISKKPVSKTIADNSKNTAYKIILGTQPKLSSYKGKYDLYIYDFEVKEKNKNSCVILTSYIYPRFEHDIFIEMVDSSKKVIQTIPLEKKDGDQIIKIDGLKQEKYELKFMEKSTSNTFHRETFTVDLTKSRKLKPKKS